MIISKTRFGPLPQRIPGSNPALRAKCKGLQVYTPSGSSFFVIEHCKITFTRRYEMVKQTELKRNVGLDLVKVISCMAVVVLHVTGMIPTAVAGYNIKTVLYYMAVFAVPLFFLVNGYSLLNKAVLTYRYIIKKILSILLIVFSWNVILFLVRLITENRLTNPLNTSLNSLIQRDYFWQLWFFGALILIYLVLPVIHKYFRNLKSAIIMTALIVALCFAVDVTSIIRSSLGLQIVQSQVPQTFRLWTWLAYYLMGGLLGKKQVTDYIKKYISVSLNWLIFIVTLIIISIYQYKMSFQYGDMRAENFYDSIFVFAYVISLFLLVCRQNFEKYNYHFTKLVSPNVMGVYILHVTLIKFATQLYKFNTLITNISLIFIVFIVSLTASIIISKVPFANRLLKI